MSAHVILNLFNKLGKRDQMRSLRAFYEFNKFKNTETRMLDYIYHMIQTFLNSHFGRENVKEVKAQLKKSPF